MADDLSPIDTCPAAFALIAGKVNTALRALRPWDNARADTGLALTLSDNGNVISINIDQLIQLLGPWPQRIPFTHASSSGGPAPADIAAGIAAAYGNLTPCTGDLLASADYLYIITNVEDCLGGTPANNGLLTIQITVNGALIIADQT
jgi:hypothetical protein